MIDTFTSKTKKDISISILWGYPYLIRLHYKGAFMGYPYPNFFAYVLFWGPITEPATACLKELENLKPKAPEPKTLNTRTLNPRPPTSNLKP